MRPGNGVSPHMRAVAVVAPFLSGFISSAEQWRSTLTGSSPPADRPGRDRVLPSELNFFRFMADHKAFALTERVFHLVQTNLDFQPLAAVRHRKPKYGVVLGRTTWPE